MTSAVLRPQTSLFGKYPVGHAEALAPIHVDSRDPGRAELYAASTPARAALVPDCCRIGSRCCDRLLLTSSPVQRPRSRNVVLTICRRRIAAQQLKRAAPRLDSAIRAQSGAVGWIGDETWAESWLCNGTRGLITLRRAREKAVPGTAAATPRQPGWQPALRQTPAAPPRSGRRPR